MGAPETRIKVVAEVDAAIKSFQTLTNSVAKTRESLTQKITAGTTTPFLTQGSLAANEAVAALQKYAEQMRTMQGSVAKSFGLTGKEAGLALKNEFAANAKGILDNVESIYGTAARDSVVKKLKEIGKQGGASYISELSKQLSTSKEVFQSSLDRIAQGAGSLGDKLSKVFDPLMNKLKQASIAIAGLGAALGGFSFTGSKGIDDAMIDIERRTGATGEALESLKSIFKDVASGADDSFGEVAKVVTDLNIRLDLSGEQLQSTAESVLNVAQMTKEGIGSISEGISSVLKNWNINATDSTATLDKLFRAWQRTQIPVGELMRQLTEFGPMLRQMGYSFDESTAMLAKFHKEGVQAGDVLIGMRKAIGEFSKAGIKDLGGEFEALSKRIKTAATDSEATRIAISTLGEKSGPALARAIREGRMELGELVKALQSSKGAVDEAAEKLKTLSEAMGELRNSAGFALAPFGDEMLSGAKQLTELTKAFSDWSMEVGLGQKAAEAFFGALGMSLPKVEEFKTSLKDIKVEDLVSKFHAAGEVLNKVGKAFGLLKEPMLWLLENADKVIIAIIAGWTTSKALKAVALIGEMYAAISKLKDGLVGLGAFLAANPIVLAGIGAAAAGGWAGYERAMTDVSANEAEFDSKRMLMIANFYAEAVRGSEEALATLKKLSPKYAEMAEESLKNAETMKKVVAASNEAKTAIKENAEALAKDSFAEQIAATISRIKTETEGVLSEYSKIKSESDALSRTLGLSAKDAGDALKDGLTKKITEARSTIEQQFGASAGDMFVRNLALMGARGGNALVAEIANSLAKIKDPLISVRTSFDDIMTGLVDSYQDLGIKSAATMKLFGASIKEAGAMFQTEMRDKILSAASQIEKAFGPAAAKQFWKMLSSMKSALGDFARSLQKELNTSSSMTKQIEDLKKFGEVTKTVLWETEKEMQVQYSNGITSITEVVQKATSGSAETMQSAEAAIQAFAAKISSSGDAMAAGAQKGLDIYAQIPDALAKISGAMGTLQVGSETASTAMQTMATSMLTSFGGISEQIAATMNKAMNALLSELEKRISQAISALKGQMDSLVPAARQAGADAGDAYATAFLAKVKAAYAAANSSTTTRQSGSIGDATADINAAARDVQYGF